MDDFGSVILALIIVLAIDLICFIVYMQGRKYTKKRISDSWGKQKEETYKNEEIKAISSYFENTKDIKKFFIDDITWNDLNMDKIFTRINNTQSSVGEEFLYNILRTPLFNEKILNIRDNIMKYFKDNYKKREKVQFIIAYLGKNRKICVSELFNSKYLKSQKIIYYKILSFIPVISIGLFFINKLLAILLFVISISFNSNLHFRKFKMKEHEIERINYAISLVHCSEKIMKLDIEDVKRYFPKIENSLSKLKSIKSNIFIIVNQGVMNEADIIMNYAKMFFLSDLIRFEKTSSILSQNIEELKDIYEFIGIIDSCIAIASYRESLDYYTNPKFSEINENNKLNFKDIYHPLIDEAVSNSCEVNKSILITGSNASGKSTFIKTIAINAVLAQTIYTCLAKEYESSYFKIYTSMAIQDNLLSKESYYIVEIKSLKRIVENINDKIPCLCFIDEILRGTNTIERISASSEILSYIANENCLCISATHDVELTNILKNVFENYHFQEEINENNITFDYKLYKGRSETRNAIKLLSIMGYSKDIVLRAEKRAEDFFNNKVWNEIKEM